MLRTYELTNLDAHTHAPTVACTWPLFLGCFAADLDHSVLFGSRRNTFVRPCVVVDGAARCHLRSIFKPSCPVRYFAAIFQKKKLTWGAQKDGIQQDRPTAVRGHTKAGWLLRDLAFFFLVRTFRVNATHNCEWFGGCGSCSRSLTCIMK